MQNNFQKTILSLFNGDFWFGEQRTSKRVMPSASAHPESIKKETYKHTEHSVTHLYLKKTPSKVVVPVTSLEAPHGYIPLQLSGIGVNELFAKHNITLKYLDLDGQLFIKSLLLISDEREFDCYHLGENHLMKIAKENESLISLTIYEKSGKSDTIYAVNGRVVS